MTFCRSHNMPPANVPAQISSLHIQKRHPTAKLMKASAAAQGPGHD